MICSMSTYAFFFFFFQAEDGIRDIGVTGVQTCALPISAAGSPRRTAPGCRSGTRPRAPRRGRRPRWDLSSLSVDVLVAGVQRVDVRLRDGQGLAELAGQRSEEHTSELQSRQYLVCRLLLEKKKNRSIESFAQNPDHQHYHTYRHVSSQKHISDQTETEPHPSVNIITPY